MANQEMEKLEGRRTGAIAAIVVGVLLGALFFSAYSLGGQKPISLVLTILCGLVPLFAGIAVLANSNKRYKHLKNEQEKRRLAYKQRDKKTTPKASKTDPYKCETCGTISVGVKVKSGRWFCQTCKRHNTSGVYVETSGYPSGLKCGDCGKISEYQGTYQGGWQCDHCGRVHSPDDWGR